MNRIPVRVRVTLAFAGVMAVVLAATGLFLYLRLGSELDATVQQGLQSRAGDVSALIAQADSGLAQSARSPLTERGENLAQILDSSGRIVDATPAVRNHPLLTRAEAQRALRGSVTLDRKVPAADENIDARLFATPVRAQDKQLVVIVGTSLEGRQDALHNLGSLLLLGGPVALLLASLAGYGTAAAALRPVERMRRRAAAIQAADPHARLPVPPADDEIGRLGQTLNEMLERLEAAFMRERTFVSDASHELRTPLAILKAELELALRAGRDPAELEEAVRSAAEETDRLVQLAEDLLVIARFEEGRLPIRSGEVDASELVEVVAERFSRRAAGEDAALTVEAPGPATLVADRLRVEQALGNLVDNALRHGGKHVELAVEEAGDRIELHVRDDGVGFGEEFLSTAFERFTRGDAARGRGGAGLGLAIVAAIAEAHGGTVGARNRPEGGADVWLELPRRPV